MGAVFLLGVAEQFAIAEAKLRAWASMDDDEEEDSNDEDSHANGQAVTFSSQSSGIHRCRHSAHFHLMSLIVIISASSLTQRPHLPALCPNYPSISRCSDFLLLPQKPPPPIPLQQSHASLRSTVARLRPPTVPWAPAAAAAACPVVGLRLIMIHIHPRPTHLLYPANA